MQLSNLTQPPLNTTLLGVIKGALDYHGIDATTAAAFGVSGHAFLINIHEQLCPSGPYCWNGDAAVPLVRNLGLAMTDLGFFSPDSSTEDRAAVEKTLREKLDAGIPCSMVNMDHQLITGYDDDGFTAAQPWDACVDTTPAKLTFGTWAEFGDNFHANFYVIEKVPPADRLTAICASLDYAVDLHQNPSAHSMDKYGVGPNAYDNWIAAVPQCGASHGNWWNAMVWSECRSMAATYLSEIGEQCAAVAQQAAHLSQTYGQIAEALSTVSNKEMDPADKISLLSETKEQESAAVTSLTSLVQSLREGSA